MRGEGEGDRCCLPPQPGAGRVKGRCATAGLVSGLEAAGSLAPWGPGPAQDRPQPWVSRPLSEQLSGW